jgi:hypothetical protein
MADIADQIDRMPSEERRKLVQELRARGCPEVYSEKERRFAAEYAVHLDRASAKEAVGNVRPIKPLLERTLEEHTKVSALKAEYIREYLLGVLELCPTDYFEFDEDGDWVTSMEKLSRAPQEVRRLVESVEFKTVRGERTLKVTFLSKTAALSLAARYTLVQKIEAAVTQVPWDAIGGVRARQGSVEDDVEARLAGPVQPDRPALAGHPAVLEAEGDHPERVG